MTKTRSTPVYFLLVDDREENLLALEALLRREGLVLLMAKSGPEALELLLKHDIALALVDVQMPGMNGFELAELMRGSERTRRVPIIFVTAGSSDLERRFRGYEAGAVDFLHKPVEPDILRSKADVFFELYRQRQEISRHRDELAIATAENARLLAESRKHAEALKEADRRKDEFLAMLAHELRNPLAPIRNAVQIVRHSSSDGMSVSTAAEMMERQVNQMVRLVDDLLDVSRISRGKIELRRERVEVASIIHHAVEAARALTQRVDQELHVTLPPDPMYLDADPTRIAQIVGNLLSNASKFTDKRGRISLTVQREENEAVLRVRDNGIGIAQSELDRIFDLFTQLDTSIERKQSGLGIGLALVNNLVEMHGGSVAVHSAGLGHGSEFMVRLPLAIEPAAKTVPPSNTDELAASAKYRVLIVDDNRDAASSLSALLSLIGHETHTAFDGLEAVKAAAEFLPDVVLLDIGLPFVNGYEVARQIRQHPWGKTMALIALTGWGQESDRQKSSESGFNGHLVKPVDLDELKRLFDELVQSPHDLTSTLKST